MGANIFCTINLPKRVRQVEYTEVVLRLVLLTMDHRNTHYFKMTTTVNVLGQKFEIANYVLKKGDYFDSIIERWSSNEDDERVINIHDRCPEVFKMILDYLIYDNLLHVKSSVGSMYK